MKIEKIAEGNKNYYADKAMTVRHRDDGPAEEYTNGYKCYYSNNKIHRIDGPAEEFPSGKKFWYLYGENMSESEFLRRIKLTSCEGKIVEIDNVKYKLVKI